MFRAFLAERVVKCRECGFVFTNPRLSPADLEKYYLEDFRLEGLDVPRSKEEFVSEEYRTIWAEKERDLGVILKHKSGGRLLDIGCASGTLLYLAREKGFAVSGVEIASRAAEFARSQLGLDVFCGQLEEAGYGDGEFDVVTSIHSLEHVPDPAGVLSEVHRILRDGGIFYGAVPNLVSWSAAKWKSRWKWLQPQNHYSHFTPAILTQALERRGFTSEMFTEEGRYGEKEIQEAHRPEEIEKIYRELRGSELIFICWKSNRPTG